MASLYHLYVESNKKTFKIRNRLEWWLAEVGGNKEMLIKGKNFQLQNE